MNRLGAARTGMPPPYGAGGGLTRGRLCRADLIREVSDLALARRSILYRRDFRCIAVFGTPVGAAQDLYPLAGSRGTHMGRYGFRATPAARGFYRRPRTKSRLRAIGKLRAVLISFVRSGAHATIPLAPTFWPKMSCASESFPAGPGEPAANHVNATFTIARPVMHRPFGERFKDSIPADADGGPDWPGRYSPHHGPDPWVTWPARPGPAMSGRSVCWLAVPPRCPTRDARPRHGP